MAVGLAREMEGKKTAVFLPISSIMGRSPMIAGRDIYPTMW